MTVVRRTVSEDDLARLKREREEADRRYNEALTALDGAKQSAPEFPHPPPAHDEAQVPPLNAGWQILSAKPAFPPGLRGRLAAFVWNLIEPAFASQESFNSLLVDHINRNIPAQRETPKAVETTIAVLREHVERLISFQIQLMHYLQQMTLYVDTKDYEFAGLGRRVAEDALDELERLDRMTRGLAAGISGVSDEMLKRWESMLARDQRYDGRIDELRSGLAVAQQQVVALKREFERSTALRPRTPTAEAGAPSAGLEPGPSSSPPEASTDSWKYVGFEDLFRGSQDEIRSRLEGYLPIFTGARDVLDIGCGRGEFLDLLRGAGIPARGLDVNHEMVEVCRSRGLDASEGDALGYLRGLQEAALGGVIATQVVEHLDPPYLMQLLDQAQRVLRPGSPIVLETINVACWLAFFESYIRDITHVRPLHPDTLKYLVTASGFVEAEVRFRAPVPPADRLQPSPKALRQVADHTGALTALADTFDGNMERLNRMMFTHLDYAVVARRP